MFRFRVVVRTNWHYIPMQL